MKVLIHAVHVYTVHTGSGEYSWYLGLDQDTVRESGTRYIKYFDGIWDLAAPREAGLTKIWAWDAGFFRCLLGIWETVTTQINFLVAKAAGVSFQTKL